MLRDLRVRAHVCVRPEADVCVSANETVASFSLYYKYPHHSQLTLDWRVDNKSNCGEPTKIVFHREECVSIERVE